MKRIHCQMIAYCYIIHIRYIFFPHRTLSSVGPLVPAGVFYILLVLVPRRVVSTVSVRFTRACSVVQESGVSNLLL